MVTQEMIRAAFEDARRQCGYVEAEVPDVAVTAWQYSRVQGIPYTTACGQLKRMVAAGAVLCGKKPTLTQDGKIRVQMLYWPRAAQ